MSDLPQMSSSPTKTFGWHDISLVPDQPGIYAWYARLLIGKADQDQFVRVVNSAKAQKADAEQIVRDALNKFVFLPFRETPYLVSISGALKPRYEGEAAHKPSASESLVARLVSEPQRLGVMATMLSTAAPIFTAPLYIGMSTDLRQRLSRHRDLINDLYNSGYRAREDSADKDGEAGFARQVVTRGFDPTNLFVCIETMPVTSNEQADLENILNRINFPIFGRN